MKALLRRGAAGATVALALVLPAAAAGQTGVGSPGLGDPFFPLAGNGGYDALHYGLRLGYDPATRVLDARAAVRARTTQPLTRFDLDLRGFTVSGVTVDGRPAAFARDGQELIVTPARPLAARERFTVAVAYAGVPQPVVDPDESIEGWVATPDGAFVVGEPQGSPGWFPCNDNPRDKATYDIAVTVPAGRTALGNGVLVSRRTHAGRTTWHWRERRPMASYLATATNGTFAFSVRRTAGGLPVYDAIDPSLGAAAHARAVANLAKEPAIVAFFSRLYGRYPFESVGGIADRAPEVGYALESQTKPNYDTGPDESTVVHELAHQWFGDAVGLAVWPDIWLNEGFATWSEWIWAERHGGDSAQQTFDALYATPATETDLWNPPPADPGDPAQLFADSIYERGAMTLQALRERIGDARFFRLLRDWYARHRYGTADTREFIALAEHVSHRPLGAFFDAWLYRPGKPASW